MLIAVPLSGTLRNVNILLYCLPGWEFPPRLFHSQPHTEQYDARNTLDASLFVRCLLALAHDEHDPLQSLLY
jgi:hypothetical protein